MIFDYLILLAIQVKNKMLLPSKKKKKVSKDRRNYCIVASSNMREIPTAKNCC